VQSQLTEEKARHQCDLLEKTWDTLNEIVADLKNRGLIIDPEIYTSLRSTKTLITLCLTHPRLGELMPHEIDSYLGFCVGCCGQDVVTRVKCELRNVEDRLIIQAMNELGNEYALKLQQKTVKAWEPFHERIVASIENLDQAIKVEKDVLSAYQRTIEENISYWIAVEEDIVDSYTKMANRNESLKVRATLTRLVEDSKDHIEVLGSIRENFRKIATDQKRHGKMLEELIEKPVA
jgi:rubrerythrin